MKNDHEGDFSMGDPVKDDSAKNSASDGLERGAGFDPVKDAGYWGDAGQLEDAGVVSPVVF